MHGNDEAHSLARGLTFRAGVIEAPLQAEERLLSSRGILSYTGSNGEYIHTPSLIPNHNAGLTLATLTNSDRPIPRTINAQ
ncbi:hypothetical protein HPB50_009017 [Hyalomma asiaticum]|uniref:Uncharacterized protein n=1 Tax=Hyalomma asiaticum TaxID=266040 RepID=A0ACB7TH49_HYAAI|nr:hypothetical protein HPB50_009017 [Hyalomma asiaticum]